MKINLLTSKTIIGTVILIIGHLIGVPELAGYQGELQAVSAIIEGIGAFITAWGVRHAIAKSSQGVAQLHPLTLVLAISLAFGRVLSPHTVPLDPEHFADLAFDDRHGVAGDSLKVVILWHSPVDSAELGKADSTVFKVIANKPFRWKGGALTAAGIVANRRYVPRGTATEFADSFYAAKPALGDSFAVKVYDFRQCRQGDCSIAGMAPWTYKRSHKPPPQAPLLRPTEM